MARHPMHLLAALALLGVAACSSPSDAPDQAAVEVKAPIEAALGVGPSSVVAGVPVGWRRDGAGARAAAISAVGLSGEIARAGFITRADMIEVLATARFAPTLERDTERQVTVLTEDLGEAGVAPATLLLRELPLTARVVAADEDVASVEVWAVLVLGAPGPGPARQVWRTVDVELTWEDGDWRVDGWSARPGPTPALSTQLPVASVDELRPVATWPSAAGGA